MFVKLSRLVVMTVMAMEAVMHRAFLRERIEQARLRHGRCLLNRKLTLTLGGVVVAGRVVTHSLILIAACRAISAGEILHRVGKIGFWIEQTFCGSSVAETARGAETDLHHAVIALADGARLIAALAHNDAMNEFDGNPVGGGVACDHAGVFVLLRGRRMNQQ